MDKARDWFTRAVTADPDYGDAWAWWYRFEQNHGSIVSGLWILFGALTNANLAWQEHRDAVATQCTMVDPHHGQVWQSVAKAPENAGKGVRAVLELAAEAVQE